MPFWRYAPSFDKFYVEPWHPSANASQWTTTLSGALAGSERKAFPYYCPSGWRRFSLDAPRRSERGFEGGCTMYHGTRPGNLQKIVANGVLAHRCQHGCKAAYFTPSVRYAAHPRYAKVVKMKGRFYQTMLEVRVSAEAVSRGRREGETLRVDGQFNIDPHYPGNKQLEFLVESEKKFVTADDGVLPTGVMVRCLERDPLLLEESEWWLAWPLHKKGVKKGAVMDSLDVECYGVSEAREWLRQECYLDAA